MGEDQAMKQVCHMADNQKERVDPEPPLATVPPVLSALRVKPIAKRTLLYVGLIVYLAAYIGVRVNGELIHRHTWSSGWNRHWIVPARTEGNVAFLAISMSENPADKETQQRILDEYDGIEKRRRVLQWVFMPCVLAESAIHWVLNPKP